MQLVGWCAAAVPLNQFVLSSWFFERLIGLVYFVAFTSLAVQIRGLVGRNGIMPAAELLERARFLPRVLRFVRFPSQPLIRPERTINRRRFRQSRKPSFPGIGR